MIANLWTGAPVVVAAAIGAGNTLEAVLGAWALHRIPDFRRSLDRVVDAVGLIVLAAIGSVAVSATIGVASLALSGLVAPERVYQTWGAWWLGDAIGDLVVAPLLLTWIPSREAASRRPRMIEGAALAVGLVGASVFLFGTTRGGMTTLLAPLLVWAALRFEQRGAALATFAIAADRALGHRARHGPFARGAIELSLVDLQAFMGSPRRPSCSRSSDRGARRARDESEGREPGEGPFWRLCPTSSERR
jgi:integral membrane sensor domain MASE1